MRLPFMREIGACFILAASVQVGAANPFDPAQVFTIEVSDSTGTGTFEVSMADAQWDVVGERIVWQGGASSPIPGPGGGSPIATLVGASFTVQYAPLAAIEWNFSLIGGSETIAVTAQTPQLSFPTIAAVDASARSAVSFGLTDGPDGYAAMFSTAFPPGTGSVRARTNGAGAAGDMFSHSVYSVSVEGLPGQSAGSVNTNQSFPNFGHQSVGHDISDMSLDIGYSLTSGDLLTTSVLMELSRPIPVPEPATFALLLLVGVGSLGRHRWQ